jgi:phosphotriesterase-related protein
MTVRGPVDPAALGITLIHEHLQVDLGATFSSHLLPEELRVHVEEPVSEELLPLLHTWPVSLCRDNVVLDDEALAADELARFASAGGTAVVDCTIIGIGRNPEAVRRIAEAVDLHVIQGTGLYVEPAHPTWVETASAEAIHDLFVRDLVHGIDGTTVRAGVIGEIGTSGVDRRTGQKRRDVTVAEEKVLRAAATAAIETGAAVIVHLDPRGQGALEVIRILSSEGLGADRMVMAHMDANPVLEYHLEVASTGCYLAYDHFGREYYAGHFGRPYPRDSQRLELLLSLLEADYEQRLLISQDVCMKIDLHRHGGNGYDHVVRHVIPRLRELGVSEKTCRMLVVENPRRVLTFHGAQAAS